MHEGLFKRFPHHLCADYISGYSADVVGHDMGATLSSFALNGDGPMDDVHRVRVHMPASCSVRLLQHLCCCNFGSNLGCTGTLRRCIDEMVQQCRLLSAERSLHLP